MLISPSFTGVQAVFYTVYDKSKSLVSGSVIVELGVGVPIVAVIQHWSLYIMNHIWTMRWYKQVENMTMERSWKIDMLLKISAFKQLLCGYLSWETCLGLCMDHLDPLSRSQRSTLKLWDELGSPRLVYKYLSWKTCLGLYLGQFDPFSRSHIGQL